MLTRAAIEKYFIAEKQGGLLFVVMGIAAMVLASLFFFVLHTNFHKGLAVPVLILGAVMGVVGFTVYTRSDEDRKRNVYAFDMNPAELRDIELPRMKTVIKNFVIYRYAELFLLLAGAALYIYYIRDFQNDFWRGFGLALAVMALLGLAADFFAEKRGKEYTRDLESFTHQ